MLRDMWYVLCVFIITKKIPLLQEGGKGKIALNSILSQANQR